MVFDCIGCEDLSAKELGEKLVNGFEDHDFDAARHYIARGADVTVVCRDGDNALKRVACMTNDTDLAKLLLDKANASHLVHNFYTKRESCVLE